MDSGVFPISGIAVILVLVIAAALVIGLGLHARRQGDIRSRSAVMAIAGIVGVLILAAFALGPLALL